MTDALHDRLADALRLHSMSLQDHGHIVAEALAAYEAAKNPAPKCTCTHYGFPWCEIDAGCPVHDVPAQQPAKKEPTKRVKLPNGKLSTIWENGAYKDIVRLDEVVAALKAQGIEVET